MPGNSLDNFVDLTGDGDFASMPKRQRLDAGAPSRRVKSEVKPEPSSRAAAPMDVDDDDIIVMSEVLPRGAGRAGTGAAAGPSRAPTPRRRASGAAAAEEAGLDDDGVMVVAEELGQVPLRDLPHARCDCGQHAFVKEGSEDNVESCSQCFCYVCDRPAKDCQFWGTGEYKQDHCQAHSSSYWDNLRKAARSGNTSVLRTIYSSRLHSAANRIDAAPAAAAAAAAPAPMPPAPARPTPVPLPVPGFMQNPWASSQPAAAKREPLPDPRKDSGMMRLGQLRLPVKAVKGTTISQLKAKLVQFDFWAQPTTYMNPMGDDYGGKLCLTNLLASIWSTTKAKKKPTFVKLLPMAPPVAEAPAGDSMRVRRVTVVHWDGAKAATTIGIKVHHSAKVSVHTAAIKAALGRLMGPNDDLMLASTSTSTSTNTSIAHDFSFLTNKDTKLTDAAVERMRIWAFRVPKAPPQKEAKPVMQPGMYGITPPTVPQYVLVMHERSLGTGSPAGGARTGGGGGGCGYGRRRDLYDSCDEEDSYFSDEDDDMDEVMMGYIDPYSARTERWGTPILLPLAKEHAQGGKAAATFPHKALMKALKPYSGTSQANIMAHTTLMRSAAQMFYPSYEPSQRPNNKLETGSTQLVSTGCTGHRGAAGVAVVFCWWTAAGAGASWGLDVARFKEPVVDATASDAVMAETAKLMKEADLRAKRMQLLADMPGKVLAELALACRASPVPTDPKKHQINVPFAATVLDLEASSDGRQTRTGTLLVDIYVWKKAGQGHRMVFTDCSTWDDPHTGGPRGFVQEKCELRETFNALVMRTPEGYKALQKWRELQAQDAEARSLKGVMEVVTAGERAAAEQPEGLTVNLHPYQLQSLKFMQDAERTEGGYRGMFWHPINTSAGRVWWSQVFDRAAVKVPAMPWGGFLAEEMGCGKTVEVLGLILSNPAPASVVSGCTSEDNTLVVTRATLVVCAVSLVGQWMAEAKSKLAGSLRIHMYHGQGRIRDADALASNYDLVVTTYATLGSDFKRDAKPPLGQIRWHRVVFDEGHTVKNPKVTHSKACIALHSERRWCCTGTPINNSIEDLYGQFCVLHMAPLFNQPWFNSVVKVAFGNQRNHYSSSTTPLLYVLNRTLIRHTKQQVIAGEEVLKLPQKTEEIVAVMLSAEEQRVYMETHKAAVRLWNECKKLHNTWINQHLLSIMALLLPLRRICSGGTLSAKDLRLPATLVDLADAISGAVPSGAGLVAPDQECSICLDSFESPVITPCGHWFCTECIKSCLSASTGCPLCRQPVDEAALRAASPAPAPQAGSDDEDMEDAGAGSSGGGVLCDSKLKALVAELKAMREADSTSKALIFSQYSCTLQWLQERLPEEGFGFRTITGSMPLKQRAKAIEAFQHDPPTTVFLLSMRSGAVGINLTAASHVFLLEPCINPALEEQAIGRAWRMGQQREVVVKRFCVQGSIEARIMDVRKQRQELSGSNPGQAALMEAPAVGTKGKQKAAAILAGNLRSDRQNLKIAELEVLFQEPKLVGADAGGASGSGGNSGAGPSNRA